MMKSQRTRISAYALLHNEGCILLCRIAPYLTRWAGQWTLPGGGLDFGESPEAAVVREVEEETGLRIKVKSLAGINTILDTSGESDFHGIRIIYHAEVIGGELCDETSGSTDGCAWQKLHPAPEVELVDLAVVGVRMAQEAWPG